MSDDDNLRELGIKFKAPPADSDLTLKIVVGECNHTGYWKGGRHKDAHYLIRDGETELECGICGQRLDPMFVLKQLARKESQWRHAREVYAEEMKRLDERRATKCKECGKMTPISRAKRREKK